MKKLLLLLIVSMHLSTVFGQKTISTSLEARNAASEYFNSATSAMEQDNYNLALVKIKQAIISDPTFRDAYLQLYQIGTMIPDSAKTIVKELNKGKLIFEEDDELFFYCGEMYRLNKNFEDAIIEYSKAITYSKSNGENFHLVPYYYLNRGNTYLKTAKYEQALDDYDYLLKLDSLSLGGLTNRGIALYKLGEKDKACKDWTNALEKGGEYAEIYCSKYCVND